MGLPSGSEWIILLVIALLIFGPKNLPRIGRALGQSIRGFKDEMKGISGEEDEDSNSKQAKTTTPDESKR